MLSGYKKQPGASGEQGKLFFRRQTVHMLYGQLFYSRYEGLRRHFPAGITQEEHVIIICTDVTNTKKGNSLEF